MVTPIKRRQLDYKDHTHGWTALFLACVAGSTSIAKLLLDAGAQQDAVDLTGWTAKEHAVHRGHLSLGRLFAPHIQVPASRLEPVKIYTVYYEKQSKKSQIFVYLGPSHTRIDPNVITLAFPLEERLNLRRINTQDRPDLSDNMVNRPVTFTVDDPTETILRFEISRHKDGSDPLETLGVATYLFKTLRDDLAPQHESIVRYRTVPIIEKDKMVCIGTLTFSLLIIAPYQTKCSLPKPSLGFWRKGTGYPIVGHRGSGANVVGKSVIQTGETTYQSFLTAIDRGASRIEFDLQLTKDPLCTTTSS